MLFLVDLPEYGILKLIAYETSALEPVDNSSLSAQSSWRFYIFHRDKSTPCSIESTCLVTQGDISMTTKLYVGNLSYEATEQELRDLFAQAGEITDLTVINDASTGRSKGFGFVEMSSDESAQEAIRLFNGYNLGDREIVVNVARPRVERSGGGSRR
jgi:cold-inducible RNA-binding protein